MNRDCFIEKQLDLIEIEKNAEIEESKTLLSSCSLQRLQLKGLCLLKLKIDQKFTGLYGRTIVVFQTALVGKPINSQYFSSGDIVSISENNVPPSQLTNTKTLITGTVTKVTTQSISVAIENDIENLDNDLNDNDTYKLIKLCNDISHKRIKNALVAIKECKFNENSSKLADILFQNRELDRIARPDELNVQFFNSNLDESQRDAVKFTFEQKDLAIIHGPPGTGKTTTLVEIIKQNCLKYKQKILCCAPSNIAVDNLVERLTRTEQGYGRVKMIRLGHPARLLESIQEYSLDSVMSKNDQYKLAADIKSDMDKTLKQLRKTSQRGEREGLKREMKTLRKELYDREDRAIKDVLNSADCILATLTTAGADGPLKHIKDNHFDLIIIDECSQALEAACWIPIMQGARKLLLAGDHLQLPPTIISKEAASKGLDLTLMKRLIDTYGDKCTKMLTTQYRMNDLINDWISDRLYESKLRAHSSVAKHLLCDLPGVERNENTSTPLVLIDTHGCDMTEMVARDENSTSGDEESKANDGEANIVCKHVSELVKSGLKQEQIAVITPYNLQMELIKAKLGSVYPLVEVKSVDGFQGREKEAIVLSLVRSNSRGEVGFLADQRRINVAITRARRHLCVVCDSQTCKNNEFLKSFLDYCDKHADVRTGFDYDNISETIGDEESLGFEDVKFAKLKVVDTPVVKRTADDKQKSIDQEDERFKKEVIRIIEKLLDPKTPIQEHTFSYKLNSRQRRIVHELAENYKIHHLSQGEDNRRFIKISTKPLNPVVAEAEQTKAEEKAEPDSKPEPVETKSDQVETTNTFSVLEPTPTESTKKKKNKNKAPAAKPTKDTGENLLGELEDQNDFDLKYRADVKQCKNCSKYILNSNYLMHEMHCVKVAQQPQAVSQPATTIKQAGACAAKSSNAAKNDKLKKNPIDTAKTDDFDELLELYQQSNNVCNYVGCKVLVRTLGQNCEFCRRRFCLNHSLAEVHGCGDEAKKQARAHIRKNGNLQVNERQSSYTEQLKHKYVEKKFHEKLEQMKAARTGSDKKKDKK